LVPKVLVPVPNENRSSLQIVSLVWNSTLENYAASYAASQDKSGGSCSGSLKHSGGPYGENLYWYWTSTGALATPAQAVNAWIAEKQYYSYKNNSCATGKVCGHYTQVVWAKTRRVGCFVRACTSNRGATYIICSYDPPGNYVGQRPY
jgi:pathogenesis-related protein 1